MKNLSMNNKLKILFTYTLALLLNIVIWNILIENYILQGFNPYIDINLGKKYESNRNVLWGLEG